MSMKIFPSIFTKRNTSNITILAKKVHLDGEVIKKTFGKYIAEFSEKKSKELNSATYLLNKENSNVNVFIDGTEVKIIRAEILEDFSAYELCSQSQCIQVELSVG